MIINNVSLPHPDAQYCETEHCATDIHSILNQLLLLHKLSTITLTSMDLVSEFNVGGECRRDEEEQVPASNCARLNLYLSMNIKLTYKV